jgi:HSP20 family molecular chaperone IbpA
LIDHLESGTMTRRDLEAWMWAEACDALARAERLHRQFFRLGQPSDGPVWEPPVDIFETEEELAIVVALPGVAPARLQITVENGVLVIAGERSAPALQRAAAIHRLEIPQGRFERQIALPSGRLELTHRDLADGCLTLVLRKIR